MTHNFIKLQLDYSCTDGEGGKNDPVDFLKTNMRSLHKYLFYQKYELSKMIANGHAHQNIFMVCRQVQETILVKVVYVLTANERVSFLALFSIPPKAAVNKNAVALKSLCSYHSL